MNAPVLDECLKTALVSGSALTATKLYRNGLYRLYPVFFVYLVLRVPNTIWPLFFPPSSGAYQKIWMLTDPPFLILYILLAVELYRLVLGKYKGLYTLGRRAVYFFSIVSVTLSALSLIPRITPSMPQRTRFMGYVFALERGVNTSLGIFLILLIIFLSLFPIRLSRNVRVHALVYPIFFLSNTFVLLMRSLWGLRMQDEFNTLMLAVSVAAVCAWLFLLSPAGESVPGVISPLPKGLEDRLLGRLEALNTVLLRSRG
jgi:hypothetical protein